MMTHEILEVTPDQYWLGNAKDSGGTNTYAIDRASKRAFIRWAQEYPSLDHARDDALRMSREYSGATPDNFRVGPVFVKRDDSHIGRYLDSLDEPKPNFAVWRETPIAEVVAQYHLTRLARPASAPGRRV